ncbi:hypothetical protein FA13DRAFT_1796955 [Coprinellus micaceus]|uniref:MYND-type domain-containing protein n=1 Tax=Coprinellus micaceus TaxID=71717 RepID=A0A4Y7SSC0_COPMI|nr:hypothetical protein FA13DRAFT_1796955 [Coprinellus micaceus]
MISLWCATTGIPFPVERTPKKTLLRLVRLYFILYRTVAMGKRSRTTTTPQACEATQALKNCLQRWSRITAPTKYLVALEDALLALCQRPPPDRPSNCIPLGRSDTTMVDLVVDIIGIVIKICLAVASIPEAERPASTLLVKSWDAVLGWMSFLQGVAIGDLERMQLNDRTAKLLHASLSLNGDHKAALLEASVQCVMNSWHIANVHGHFPRQPAVGDDYVYTALLQIYLGSLDGQKLLAQVHATPGYRRLTIKSTIVQLEAVQNRCKRRATCSAIALHQITVIVSFMRLLCGLRHAHTWEHILEGMAIHRLFAVLGCIAMDDGATQLQLRGSASATHHVIAWLQDTPAYIGRKFQQALEGGLVNAVAALIGGLDRNTEESDTLRQDMANITAHLSHPRILRAMENLFLVTPPLFPRPFLPIWGDMVLGMREGRVSVGSGSTGSNTCDNVTHHSQRILGGAEPTSNLPPRVCSGCHTTMYCSFQCQKLDWNYFHRSECSALAAQYKERRATRSWPSAKARLHHRALLRHFSNNQTVIRKFMMISTQSQSARMLLLDPVRESPTFLPLGPESNLPDLVPSVWRRRMKGYIKQVCEDPNGCLVTTSFKYGNEDITTYGRLLFKPEGRAFALLHSLFILDD